MFNFVKKITSVIATMAIALSALVFTASPAQAAVVLDANGVSLNFNENTQTRVVIAGGTGTAMGKTAGDIVVYRGVATVSGTVVDAVIETISVTNTTIGSFDGGSAISGAPQYLQTNLTTNNAGSVVYRFSFYTGGTYTAVGTGTPVILQNVYINTYDLDASGNGSNQYTEFTGVQSYTRSTNTTTVVSASGNLLQFKYNGANNSENYNANSGSYTKGRVQVKYDNLSVISIKIGNDSAGTGGLSYFALDFSLGLPWTEGTATTFQGQTFVNGFNSPPTSTNDTVTAQPATFLTSDDFGTYADPDVNPWVSVRLDTLPSGGTLQWFNGTSWIGVTGNQVISVSDLEANRLRYTSNAQTTSDSLTFRVSDGLLNSVSAYTLSITVTGGSQAMTAQVITFAQPADQLMSSGTLTVAPTADSGLTVSLASTTPGICTVSGFVITLVSIGNCSLTASQSGDSTYSAAANVLRTFAITNPQIITFAQPAAQVMSSGTLTVAPTADSGLTVSLASTTPGICLVSGFVVTFVSAGNCSLTASQAGGSNYSAATNVVRSFAITSSQVITFAQPSDQLLSATSIALAPTANSGLTVSLTSTTTSICTVSGFVVTLVATGNCSLTASQAGNSTYLAATNVVRSFAITNSQTITFAQPADQLLSASSFTVAPTASSGLTVTLIATTPAVCSVTGFVVTFLANGVCALTSSQAGNGTFSPAVDVVRNFNVSTPGEQQPALPAAPDIEPISSKGDGSTPIALPAPINLGTGGSSCLIDPADSICKQTVTVPGKGTFTLSPDGKTTFTAVAGFFGALTVQYRVTDGYGRFDTAPVTVEIVNPNPTSETVGTSQSGTTAGVSPVVLTHESPLPRGGQFCLIDPADSVCKTVVRVSGVGTWTQARDGSVRFVAVQGYVGSTTVNQRFTRAALSPRLTPFTVSVAKSRGPVTVTISGFADGSPVLTAAIRARINAFLRAHADYKNVFCIGYTEGPTVLPTDAALSRQRAVNGCAFVKSGLGKQLTLKQLTASQGTVEAAKCRRITITLTD
jgi:hypothetical protein